MSDTTPGPPYAPKEPTKNCCNPSLRFNRHCRPLRLPSHFGPQCRWPFSNPDRAPLASSIGDGLVSNPCMISAVWQPNHGLAATEKEVGLTRITNWPMTFVLGQFQNGAALSDRHHVFDRKRLRLKF